jgi:hypothetical protein
VTVHAFGSINWTAEIGEVLAWLGTALRPPAGDCKTMCCNPSVAVELAKPYAGSIMAVMCHIRYDYDPLPAPAFGPHGCCWHDLFHNSVIAKGFPIPKKPSDIVGLELSLSAMAALTEASLVTDFGGCLFLKGFSSMLVLMYISGETCQWHYLFNEDGSRIQYTDRRVRNTNPLKVDDISKLRSSIGSMRHGIGWCQNVHWLIGKRLISLNLFPHP